MADNFLRYGFVVYGWMFLHQKAREPSDYFGQNHRRYQYSISVPVNFCGFCPRIYSQTVLFWYHCRASNPRHSNILQHHTAWVKSGQAFVLGFFTSWGIFVLLILASWAIFVRSVNSSLSHRLGHFDQALRPALPKVVAGFCMWCPFAQLADS